MNTHDKIELPPLPAGYTLEFASAMRNYARSAIEADRLKKEDYINDDRDMLRAEIVALKGTIADLQAKNERLREVLKELISWVPTADVYRRLGFAPETPMRALEMARDVLTKGEPQ